MAGTDSVTGADSGSTGPVMIGPDGDFGLDSVLVFFAWPVAEPGEADCVAWGSDGVAAEVVVCVGPVVERFVGGEDSGGSGVSGESTPARTSVFDVTPTALESGALEVACAERGPAAIVPAAAAGG